MCVPMFTGLRWRSRLIVHTVCHERRDRGMARARTVEGLRRSQVGTLVVYLQ